MRSNCRGCVSPIGKTGSKKSTLDGASTIADEIRNITLNVDTDPPGTDLIAVTAHEGTVSHNDGRNQTIDVGDTKIADGTSVEFLSLGVSVGASGRISIFRPLLSSQEA